MAFAIEKITDLYGTNKVEHIELREFHAPGPSARQQRDERRISNRTSAHNIKVSRVVKKDIFRIWQHVKNIPC
ncbi:MAG: hypothetical protein AAF387_02110, partial [Pseudomonadota bacterium]